MSKHFIKTDLDLLAIPGLSPRLRELYGRLRLHAGKDGKCCPTHATLAQEIGLGTRQHLQRLLTHLQRLKLIEWKRGRYSNEYRVLDPDATFLLHLEPSRCNFSVPSDATSTFRGASRYKEGKELRKEENPPTPLTERSPGSSQPKLPGICASADARVGESALAITPRYGNAHPRDWFAEWWAIYWRRVARKPAEKAFRAAVKTEERFAQVMAATRAQTAMMMAREPCHRPHGSTWLNGERWNDESSAPATARKPPQSSLIERTMALWEERIANGERPI